MAGSSKIPKFKHHMPHRERVRLHVMLKTRMMECGKREEANKIAREVRDNKTPTLAELKRRLMPDNSAIPDFVRIEVLRELEYYNGPRIVYGRSGSYQHIRPIDLQALQNGQYWN